MNDMNELDPLARERRGWTEVSAKVLGGWHELVAESLATLCDSSVSMERLPGEDGFQLRGYLPQHLDTPAWRQELSDQMARLAQSAGAEELRDLRLVYGTIPVQDFANAWRKTWKPLRIGSIVIVPPEWEGRQKPTDIRIDLIPGGAFGTGHHATTRSCIKELVKRVKEGDRVLDAGCGSGILGVIAARLGAQSVFGFDIDSGALPYATDLAEMNRVGERCEFCHGGFELLGSTRDPFDGIVANLYGDLIRDKAATLAASLRPQGWFSLGGCSEDREPAVRASLAEADLLIESVWRRGKWVAFHGLKGSGKDES